MSKYHLCLFGAILATAAPAIVEAQLIQTVQSNESKANPTINPTFSTRQSMAKAIGALTSPRKDEFESTSDFDAKKCEEFFKAVGGSADTVFHFIVFGRDSLLSQPYYDADKQEYRFLAREIFPSLYASLTTKTHLGLILDRVTSPGKSYVGQNAFGATKKIDVSNEKTVGILLPTSSRTPLIKFALHAAPDSARRFKGDLELVVSTKIESPCIDSGRYHSSPTIDSPTETTDSLIGLVGSSDATWEIIKSSSGEVLMSGSF